jgi:UDP-2,3-diacylglucosamine hydrolase
MTTLFISDLHLAATQPELNRQFIVLLEQAQTEAEAVYILGDLFDRWIGDDNLQPYLVPIYAALKSLTQHIPCYFIVGNRDFLIGEQFCRETGVTLLQEPVLINLYGMKTLLMHGDLLCIDDKRYQAYRIKSRNPITIKRFLRTPLWFRKAVAATMRLLSIRHQKKQQHVILDANQNEILRQIQLSNADLLIYGHTHRPGIHLYRDGNNFKRWIVLGDWHEERYSALWVHDDGSFELMM